MLHQTIGAFTTFFDIFHRELGLSAGDIIKAQQVLRWVVFIACTPLKGFAWSDPSATGILDGSGHEISYERRQAVLIRAQSAYLAAIVVCQ